PTVLSILFTAPATTELYTLSLHDALPILTKREMTPPAMSTRFESTWLDQRYCVTLNDTPTTRMAGSTSKVSLQLTMARTSWTSRSEEHTSELQSRFDLVCRLLLEKKNRKP